MRWTRVTDDTEIVIVGLGRGKPKTRA